MVDYTDHDMGRRCKVQVRLYKGLCLVLEPVQVFVLEPVLIAVLVQLLVLARVEQGYHDMGPSAVVVSAEHGLYRMAGNLPVAFVYRLAAVLFQPDAAYHEAVQVLASTGCWAVSASRYFRNHYSPVM